MEIKSAMSGTVWKILVQVGDEVQEGQDVAILESMKMEIPITAEHAGKVLEIGKNEGDFVQEDDVLIVLE